MDHLKQRLIAEARRIEECSACSAKSHYNSADYWGNCHLGIGLPAVVFGSMAAASGFADNAIWASILATMATVFTTVLTFIKPSERAETHKAVASQYHALRNSARLFLEIELEDSADTCEAKKRLMEMAQARDELNQRAPTPSRRHFEKARKDLEGGRHKHSERVLAEVSVTV